ncbi:MAG: hypothetical protein DRP09_14085 [Candidatus Thorarchaeota archaeon]|nr:MAG: hypothetical protein DRP09_14085 [Candidatus Thorarchaeota archaeon]
MSKVLDLVVDFITYDGTASNNPSDAIKIKNAISESAVLGTVRYQSQLVNGATDVNITIPDPSSEYLLFFTDREVIIKLNGGSQALTLTPKTNSVKCFVFFYRGSLTQLQVSNASGEVANLDIISVNI